MLNSALVWFMSMKKRRMYEEKTGSLCFINGFWPYNFAMGGVDSKALDLSSSGQIYSNGALINDVSYKGLSAGIKVTRMTFSLDKGHPSSVHNHYGSGRIENTNSNGQGAKVEWTGESEPFSGFRDNDIRLLLGIELNPSFNENFFSSDKTEIEFDNAIRVEKPTSLKLKQVDSLPGKTEFYKNNDGEEIYYRSHSLLVPKETANEKYQRGSLNVANFGYSNLPNQHFVHLHTIDQLFRPSLEVVFKDETGKVIEGSTNIPDYTLKGSFNFNEFLDSTAYKDSQSPLSFTLSNAEPKTYYDTLIDFVDLKKIYENVNDDSLIQISNKAENSSLSNYTMKIKRKQAVEAGRHASDPNQFNFVIEFQKKSKVKLVSNYIYEGRENPAPSYTMSFENGTSYTDDLGQSFAEKVVEEGNQEVGELYFESSFSSTPKISLKLKKVGSVDVSANSDNLPLEILLEEREPQKMIFETEKYKVELEGEFEETEGKHTTGTISSEEADTEVGTVLLNVKVTEKGKTSQIEPKLPVQPSKPSEPIEKEDIKQKEKEDDTLKETESKGKEEVTVTSYLEPPKEVESSVSEGAIADVVETPEVGAVEEPEFSVITPSEEELDDIEIDSTETPLGNAHIEEENLKNGKSRLLAKTGGLNNYFVLSICGFFALILVYGFFLKKKV